MYSYLYKRIVLGHDVWPSLTCIAPLARQLPRSKAPIIHIAYRSARLILCTISGDIC